EPGRAGLRVHPPRRGGHGEVAGAEPAERRPGIPERADRGRRWLAEPGQRPLLTLSIFSFSGSPGSSPGLPSFRLSSPLDAKSATLQPAAPVRTNGGTAKGPPERRCHVSKIVLRCRYPRPPDPSDGWRRPGASARGPGAVGRPVDPGLAVGEARPGVG